MRAALVGLTLGLAAAGAAKAAVLDAQANGFAVRQTRQVAAPPARVWASLLDVGAWWASDHTYSGDATKLTLDARPGGCWCEALPGGGVEHARVVYMAPTAGLRLEGAFGPLQSAGGQGHLAFTLTPKDGGTELVVDYVFGGYRPGGFAPLAPLVDAVFAGQAARLQATAEGRAP